MSPAPRLALVRPSGVGVGKSALPADVEIAATFTGFVRRCHGSIVARACVTTAPKVLRVFRLC